MPPVPPTPDPIPQGLATLVWTYGKNEHTPGPGFGLDAWQHAGPKYIWVRDIRPLVDGEELTPFTRAAMAGDMVSSLTHFGTEGLQFINADYTLTLSRLPEGPYLGLAALTHYSHDGVATGVATIVDQHGPIGSGVATALSNPASTRRTLNAAAGPPPGSRGPSIPLRIPATRRSRRRRR